MAPCRLYSQGLHCRFGDKCKFSHDVDLQAQSASANGNKKNTSDSQRSAPHLRKRPDGSSSNAISNSQVHLQDSSDTRPRPKRGEIPCRAWKAGTCTKGSKCWFCHDIDVQKPGSKLLGPHQQKPTVTAPLAPHPTNPEEGSPTSSAADKQRAELLLAQAAEASAARERAEFIAREEAAKTISQLVFGSIVTYSAGLDVSSLITGFDTCTLHIANLPFDTKDEEVHTLLKNQGVDASHFHLVMKKKSDRRFEAQIVTDMVTGRALVSRLDGIEFQEENLVVEMSATNSLEGMSATAGQSSEILTISWHSPSARYIAEYPDAAAASAKVSELNRSIFGGRRIKVGMNTRPRGSFTFNLRLNTIKINNLPPTVTDNEVMELTNSLFVKRLPITFGTVHPFMAELIRTDIERVVPGGLKKFDDPPATCNMEGVISARAHFSSWDDAHIAYTQLSNKRYGSQHIWFRLPDPMYFTLFVPSEQYKAQKAQWDSLSSSIKDRKACSLNVRDSGNAVIIRLSGTVKEATGALKVRVENLARGDKVEGWHRSLGFSGHTFIPRVLSETGAYLRADWKRQTLKVYGTPNAVDRAREMIKCELDRLASLDHTVTLARHSVGFFVREGIQHLKDTIGENNVKFVMPTRKITVSGGEDARHTLDRLIELSHKGNLGLPNKSEDGRSCPVCYDDITTPHQLGCGHAYCVACLRHLISSALESDQLPLICLGDEAQCRVPISIPTIQHFLPPAAFKRLLEAAFDSYVAKHPEELKHCKTPDCTQIYRAAQDGATPQTLQCPSCFSAVCNGCHEDPHDDLSCTENKMRQESAKQGPLEAWISSQGGRVKKCPQCNVPIEKTQGCNHMTCRCGAHICWRCMRVFSENTIYPHMRSEHGTIHDDAPAAPEPPGDIGIPVDIEEQRELFRQVEMRRREAQYGNGNVNDARPRWVRLAAAHDAERDRRVREARERVERLQLAQLQLQREAEELERRRLREAEERRERERERQDGGWGCTVM